MEQSKAKALLNDLILVLRDLEKDLRDRANPSGEAPEIHLVLHADYDRARESSRTAASFEQWCEEQITQKAVAWILSCVFVRFLEDNGLVDPPRISGPTNKLKRARDEHELYFEAHPTETDREYLLNIFNVLGELPAGRDIFGPHNPIHIYPGWLSGDAAGQLLTFFQKIEPETGQLLHDFTDPDWDTRFLGDLYQDLSEAARKRYALLQTPEFVEEFILDRTLEPALDEFGLNPPSIKNEGGEEICPAGFRMIDPACGSGHFLLGAFDRILNRWRKKEPTGKDRDLVQRTLDAICGVDVNPYAVAIARFRLLLKALKESSIHRLKDAPDFRFTLAAGDSLLHGSRAATQGIQMAFDGSDVTQTHVYAAEDRGALLRILHHGIYHVVVANPPYLTVKDSALNRGYRDRFGACHRKYSMSVPFMERIFDLAIGGVEGVAGFTGQITSNSFMKREFGKKLVEQFICHWDLTHVIDTQGAYIPGHGTPTVILFGRHRRPISNIVRTVMGIRGEPSTPDIPAQGKVWNAICAQIDQPGSESEYVSVADTDRERFAVHPWSIGGGGKAELKEKIELASETLLKDVISEVGVFGITAADDVMYAPSSAYARKGVTYAYRRRLILGDEVRDWQVAEGDDVLFPYTEEELIEIHPSMGIYRWLWPNRTTLWSRVTFSKQTYRQEGRTWWEWHQITLRRLRTPLSIVYGEVSTHNHFVLDRGGKVFKQTAPVIKLTSEATEENHLAVIGLLNSSTACFWMKQVCHQKQMMGGDGIRIESKAKVPYAFNGTALGKMPVPASWYTGPLRERLIQLAKDLDAITKQYTSLNGNAAIKNGEVVKSAIKERWDAYRSSRRQLRSAQVLLQEEIDFTIYAMFNLVSQDLLGSSIAWNECDIAEGERPFCIIAQDNEDGFSVPPEVPNDWPETVQALWQKRIEAIRNSRELRLLESSIFKRRWIGRQGLFNHRRTDNELGDAARAWLLNRLENYFDFDGRMNDESTPAAQVDIALISTAVLADLARPDQQFMEVGALYRNDAAFDVQTLVDELVAAESVPLLPICRYKASGFRKRAVWEKTWQLQRAEDVIDSRTKLPKDDPQYLTETAAKELKEQEIGDIPVPEGYRSSDFISSGGARYWALRGKLDVPKERWVSFPHCDAADGTPMIAWAGYNHLQLAHAISGYYVDVQEKTGGRGDPRLENLLACLLELLPWLKQWHNEMDPEFNQRMGDYYEDFIKDEARQMDKSLDDIRQWQPPQTVRRRKRKKTR